MLSSSERFVVTAIAVFREISTSTISSPDFEPYGVTPYEEPPYVKITF